MNILIISDNFFPDDVGGGGRVVRELGRGLAAKGHAVFVLTRQGRHESPLEEFCDGMRVYRYPVNHDNTFRTFLSTLIYTHRLLNKILDHTSMDIINFHQPLTSLALCVNPRIKGIKKIYTFHSPWHQEYEIKTASFNNKKRWLPNLCRQINIFLRRKIEKFVLQNCSQCIVLSSYMKELLIKTHHYNPLNINIIKGGVDIKRFVPTDDKAKVRTLLGLPDGKLILLTIRHLTARMGLENLIEAVSKVSKLNKNILLVIGGKGHLRGQLENLVDELGMRKFIFFSGFIDDQQLPCYYQAADFFILPTKYLEGFGLVTVEALASGLPVLGTPVGATEEILADCDSALLFKDTSSNTMAELILKYSMIDPFEYHCLSIKCRQYVEDNFTWERAVTQTLEQFQRVCGKS